MTNPANSLCFLRKMRVVQRPQIPCVFSSKMRLAFNVTVNLYGFQIPCVFPSKTRLGFKVTVNLHVMRSAASTSLAFFHRKYSSQESCRIPWVHFPCVFSRKMSLGFRSCEFTCDAANRSGTLNIFPRKTRLAGGIPRGHRHGKCLFVPKPGRRPNVDKGAL